MKLLIASSRSPDISPAVRPVPLCAAVTLLRSTSCSAPHPYFFLKASFSFSALFSANSLFLIALFSRLAEELRVFFLFTNVALRKAACLLDSAKDKGLSFFFKPRTDLYRAAFCLSPFMIFFSDFCIRSIC